MINKIQMIFQEIDGLWVAVDSACQTPPTLADTLSKLKIVIDDNTQFCRIIRYKGRIKETIEFRAYGGRIRINHTQSKE